MTRAVPALTLFVVLAFGALTTGCTSVVQGSAVKPAASVPADDLPPLDESVLDGLMLSNRELNEIAGVEMESFYSAEEMNDNADLVSDADCLGAVYPGEDAVYDGARWTAVRDELLLAAGSDNNSKLIEQTLVLFATHDDAIDFFDASKDTWRECAQAEDIEVEDGAWVPQAVQEVDERTMSLKAEVSGTLEGICEHAMGVVSNLVVEGFSCDADDNDDAQKITTRLLEDAAEQ